MFFLNLSLGEFLTVLGALGGLVTALYFLDRTRRKRTVSTLRFWTPAHSAEQQQSRRRVNDPWSLLLQLMGLLLLLLAAAELEWGSRARLGRDHVLLLDTSAWSGDAAAGRSGGTSVLDREKVLAGQYLSAIPANDRVMLVQADGLTSPVTSFTANRAELRRALAEATPSFSALNLEQAFSFATQAQTWSNGAAGEIVYVGARMVDDDAKLSKPANLRVLTVDGKRENAGIRRLSVKRGEHEADSWQANVTLKNYSNTNRPVQLQTQFAGTRFAPRAVMLKPGEETGVIYDFITHTGGDLIARIETEDSLASDNRATLQLPKSGPFRVAVFTDRPDTLRPLFAANWRLNVAYFRPDEYAAEPKADLVVIDGFATNAAPKVASLWILPAKGASPLAVKTQVNDTTITNWHGETALGAGLHAKEAKLRHAEIFETGAGDTAVASVAAGPVVVARAATAAHPKIAVMGFDPLTPELKFEITTPLLFANLLHWLSPESFRTIELSAGSVGGASVTLDPSERAESIRVTDAQGVPVPFTVRSRALQFFASKPTIAHVVSDDRERVLSLTLPDVAEKEWSPSAEVTRDLPAMSGFLPNAVDLWKWLAVAGALCLLAEWIFFGQQRTPRFGKKAAAPPTAGSTQRPKVMAS
jgi:hypothetical protein